MKNLYLGDATKVAARRVGVSRDTGDRWLSAWNDASLDGLRPSFAGGRPAKLSPAQFEEFFAFLEEVGCHKTVSMAFGHGQRSPLSLLLNGGDILYLSDIVFRGAAEVCEEFYDTPLRKGNPGPHKRSTTFCGSATASPTTVLT
ncbi:helix-turn-helix domain-containing protein [Haloarcula sp. 1CSR25-25]|uniref:helix-turn-helix domain-containing protein n=1 Tax=Haloarcula sp. 1CSR25-25 TaxID=2862545 RepID=UPI0037C05893